MNKKDVEAITAAFTDAALFGIYANVTDEGITHIPRDEWVVNIEFERMQFAAWFGEQYGYDAFPETVVSGAAWAAWQARALWPTKESA